jgi:hypothetical protein
MKGKTVQIIHIFSPFLTNVGLPRKNKQQVWRKLSKSQILPLASAPDPQ